MAHIRASHLIVRPDDIEDATMSLHLSTKTPTQSRGQGSTTDGGCIDSLGRYQPLGAKRQWNITVPMAFAALCASLANLARGFVLGYSSPSIPELQTLHLLTNDNDTSWYGSFTPIGSLIGALLGGFFTHRLGRKLSTMITCLPLAFGWLSIVAADSIGWLYLGRILTGVGNGMSSLVTSVYVSEVASSNARGMLGTINQIATSVGVLIVYALPFVLDYRWLAIFGGFNAAATMILMVFMPETPRWLVSKGRIGEAVDNFMWLRGCDQETAQLVIRTLEEEMIKQQTTFSIRELFNKEILKPFFVSQLSMVFQQLTGLFVLLFYTQTIFEMVGFSNGKAATAVMGAVTVIAYAFTPFLVERTGRRIMLNISAVGVMISATVLGVCFYIHDRDLAEQNGAKAVTTIPPPPITSTAGIITPAGITPASIITPTDLTTAAIGSMNSTTAASLVTTSFSPLVTALANSSSFTSSMSAFSATTTLTAAATTTTIDPLTTAASALNATIAAPAATSRPPPSAALSYVALISAVCYMASYSLGYGPLPWVLISELIPLRARATVGGVAVFLTWLLTFIVTKVFAPLSALIGVAGCFWIFAGFSAVSLVYVALLLPETKGRSLEEIEHYFTEGHFPDKVKRRKFTIRISRSSSRNTRHTPSPPLPATPQTEGLATMT